ncbi:ATP-dependent acyl-CoA ligase [Streptomyces sp. HC44]|uniref:ATP-dependent acyl-CoA ligase n=1 Tax=Streptomyces scabichelini TaxID=2711217 RepID=A0A6G4VHR0_9ACTN|nr:AMP-binding protein [Streptomyces scabichelini]NGO13692.1 ATP-dependent acyl-CoA ligase [Streptomyces scabichelini]
MSTPSPQECVLTVQLAARADLHPDRLFAVFDDGESWTYADAWRLARSTGAALQRYGVTRGEPVLSWLPNGPHQLRTWFGTNAAGGVHVPLNTAYRWRMLERVIRDTGARTLVTCQALVGHLTGLDLGRTENIVVIDAPESEPLAADPGQLRPLAEPLMPWDTQAIIHTSGTTGPSKGVLCSYAHLHTSATASFRDWLTSDDRYLVNLPLFHGGGVIGTLGMLGLGGSIAVVSHFRTESFWQQVRELEVTACTLLGVMASFLVSRPPSEPSESEDTGHPLRTAYVLPLTEPAFELSARFGVEIRTLFNMTETSCPVVSGDRAVRTGSCGRPRPGIEARVVDPYDREVPVGTVGELVLRSDAPWVFSHGYHGMPEATAAAWRNGWFHTGDAFRQDADGELYFVDRLKDAIRRRGENISSFEVEEELRAHPGVRDAAAVGVPGEHGEQEVLAVVCPVPGERFDPAGLLEFLRPRTAHFMLPRYIRTVSELPVTPTGKVRKEALREEGITPDTWDRQAAGITIRRDPVATRREDHEQSHD